MRFNTVILRFTRQSYYSNEQAFQLTVRQSPEPLPGGAFIANVEAQLAQFEQLFNWRVGQNQFFYRYQDTTLNHAQDLADMGRQLYAILPEAFQQAFPLVIQRVFNKGQGLRLIVEASAGDKADKLLSLPWELLFFEETGVYPARSSRVVITRRLLDAIRRRVPADKPLGSVLHVVAHSPNAPEPYQVEAGLRRIEQETFERVMLPQNYRRVDASGSVEQMLAAIKEQPAEVVHFLGHGEMPTADESDTQPAHPGRGYLRFVENNGQAQWVTGEQLQALLDFSPDTQLVVLNACHAGAGIATNLALELVYSGLPYVVAFQSGILQETAGYFVEAFYTELQRGKPIDEAVAAGRANIAANMPNSLDWCLPALYTGAGLLEPGIAAEATARWWHWAGKPQTGPQFAWSNFWFGIAQLFLALLLLISRVAPPLPNVYAFSWIMVGLMIAPLLLAGGAYLGKQLALPEKWPFASKVALLANSLNSAAIGLAMTSFYGGLLLLLLAAMGLFGLLSVGAQVLVMGVVFAPGLLLGYSQVVGHGRAFIDNGRVELPRFKWDDLVISVAAYFLLLVLWAMFVFGAAIVSPPVGNGVAGLFLIVLGGVMLKTGRD